MSQYVTDTHALIWHLFHTRKLSPKVQNVFEKADIGEHQIVIPAITLVEIVYLAERGRIAADAVQQVLRLLQDESDNYVVAPLDMGVAIALQQIDRATIPEMPDRIIAATALHLGLPLLTRDHKIRAETSIVTVW